MRSRAIDELHTRIIHTKCFFSLSSFKKKRMQLNMIINKIIIICICCEDKNYIYVCVCELLLIMKILNNYYIS